MVNRIVLSKNDAIAQLTEFEKVLLKKSFSEKFMKSDCTNAMTHIDNLVLLLNCCNIEKVCFYCFSSERKDVEKICKKNNSIPLYFPSGHLFWKEFIGIG